MFQDCETKGKNPRSVFFFLPGRWRWWQGLEIWILEGCSRGLRRRLGPPFFGQIFLSGWRECLGEQQLAFDSTQPGAWLFLFVVWTSTEQVNGEPCGEREREQRGVR